MNLATPVQTFWCEPTGRIRRFLRCFQSYRTGEDAGPCAGYCNARIPLDEVEIEYDSREDGTKFQRGYSAKDWPWDAFKTACDKCGVEMPAPERQIFTDQIFVVKTGERAGQVFARREAPVGAIWEIEHYRDIPDWQGPDGMAINVVLPGGEWSPDGRANNCTKPGDTKHRCWVRHGDPRTGYVHVDKAGTAERPTCEAGAGSIWMNAPTGFHGFVHRGYVTDCNHGGREAVDRILDASNPIAPAERVTPAVVSDMRRFRNQHLRRGVAVAAKPVRRWASNR